MNIELMSIGYHADYEKRKFQFWDNDNNKSYEKSFIELTEDEFQVAIRDMRKELKLNKNLIGAVLTLEGKYRDIAKSLAKYHKF